MYGAPLNRSAESDWFLQNVKGKCLVALDIDSKNDQTGRDSSWTCISKTHCKYAYLHSAIFGISLPGFLQVTKLLVDVKALVSIVPYLFG